MVNEQGVQDNGTFSVSFDPSYQELVLHRVQLHRNGRVINQLGPSALKIIHPEEALAEDIYNGDQSATLFLKDLRIPYSLHQTHYFEVHLPEKWDVQNRSNTIKKDCFEYDFRQRVEDRTISFKYELVTLRSEVAPDQVAGYLKQLEEMNDDLRVTTFPDLASLCVCIQEGKGYVHSLTRGDEYL